MSFISFYFLPSFLFLLPHLSFIPVSLIPLFLFFFTSSSLPFPQSIGLCPELQNLFAMTMTSSDQLPFPLRVVNRNEDHDMIRDRVGDRESFSMEAVRDGSLQGVSSLLDC